MGKAVSLAIASGQCLADMSLAQLQDVSELIAEDVFSVLTLEGSVNARDHAGGTAPARVRAAAAAARAAIAAR